MNRVGNMKNSDFYSHQQTHILALSIRQQNTQMQLMLDILLEEHRTLSSTDVDQFERVVSKKQELVNQIESTQIQLTEIHLYHFQPIDTFLLRNWKCNY